MKRLLLTRDQYREGVFARDKNKCVICGDTGKLDAHHILERRLWSDGGYYLDNGASLCEPHHLEAEQTTISCDDLRQAAKISKVLLPPHLYDDQAYDKWGNPILQNGTRLRGELFDDESVQKVLAPVLNLFTDRVKYPRTYHLPWSPGMTDDDRMADDVDAMFGGREVVITEKMDGENTTMYADYMHARSIEYSPHASRDRVKAMHAAIGHDIPKGWRVCGENLFAKHAIHYTELDSYFQVFSVWNDKNVCLSWDETIEWASLLGFPVVRELYRGTWGAIQVDAVTKIVKLGRDDREGYVVRLADGFHYKDFRRSVAKYVRANHVPVHGGHWVNRVVIPNELRKP